MMEASYYRERAQDARRAARAAGSAEVKALLECMARDYEELALDLEDGAIEFLHPELLPQQKRHA